MSPKAKEILFLILFGGLGTLTAWLFDIFYVDNVIFNILAVILELAFWVIIWFWPFRQPKSQQKLKKKKSGDCPQIPIL
jgi:hypothetical protein